MFFVGLHTFSLDLIHLFRWENYDYVEYMISNFELRWIELSWTCTGIHMNVCNWNILWVVFKNSSRKYNFYIQFA